MKHTVCIPLDSALFLGTAAVRGAIHSAPPPPQGSHNIATIEIDCQGAVLETRTQFFPVKYWPYLNTAHDYQTDDTV